MEVDGKEVRNRQKLKYIEVLRLNMFIIMSKDLVA